MYHHFRIAKTVSTFLPRHFSNHTIFLKININGLPLFKSSKTQFWPIFCDIAYLDTAPFIVGLFCGESKPTDIFAYLDKFVSEMKFLSENGLAIGDKTYLIKILHFICDAPARAFLKQIKGHNA